MSTARVLPLFPPARAVESRSKRSPGHPPQNKEPRCEVTELSARFWAPARVSTIRRPDPFGSSLICRFRPETAKGITREAAGLQKSHRKNEGERAISEIRPFRADQRGPRCKGAGTNYRRGTRREDRRKWKTLNVFEEESFIGFFFWPQRRPRFESAVQGQLHRIDRLRRS